jgi:hypothetical protein
MTTPESQPQEEPADDTFADNPADLELIAYLDGELTEPQARQLEARLSQSSAERTKLDSYKKTWDLLDNLPKIAPSRNFTEKTIERLEPLALTTLVQPAGRALSATVAAISTSTLTPQVLPSRRRFSGWVWAATLLAGLSLGYFSRQFWDDYKTARIEKDRDAEAFADTRLLKNLHLYKYVDDLEFIQDLDKPELFGDTAKE